MRRLPAKYDLTAMSPSPEETNDPLIADHRNFYKVEKWTEVGPRSIGCCSPAATCRSLGKITMAQPSPLSAPGAASEVGAATEVGSGAKSL